MKIDLVVDLRDRGAARFDEVKIQRLVWNLARNAIEAMHGGGTLTIGVSRDRDDLVLRVSDTGTGIPEDVRHRMFGSFVTSGKRGGTGLGLSLVKKIVEEHHGSVSYETGTTGTTFTVRLPQTEHEGRTVLEANGDDAATKDPTKPRKKRERRESSTGEP
jgi:signal transduction histidine kinase